MIDEPAASAEEAAEAAALAAFLEDHGAAPSAGVEDAVDAAAILRHHAPLDDLRKERVRRRVLRDLSLRARERTARFLAAGLVAAGLAFLVWTQSTVDQRVMPPPDAALLTAQAEAIRGHDPSAYDAALRAYRSLYLASPSLALAQVAHAAIDRGDLAAAGVEIDRLAELDLPAAYRKAVLQDALVHLADAELAAADADAATHAIDRGVSLGIDRNVFGVGLLIARARTFAARGEAQREAAALYEALLLSDALLDATLGDR
jgi:hypothetical protein